MLVKATTSLAAIALLLATSAMASPVDQSVGDVGVAEDMSQTTGVSPNDDDGDFHTLIAINKYYACRCPNNCSHKENSSCKYKAGPSTHSSTVKGKCKKGNDKKLYCQAT